MKLIKQIPFNVENSLYDAQSRIQVMGQSKYGISLHNSFLNLDTFEFDETPKFSQAASPTIPAHLNCLNGIYTISNFDANQVHSSSLYSKRIIDKELKDLKFEFKNSNGQIFHVMFAGRYIRFISESNVYTVDFDAQITTPGFSPNFRSAFSKLIDEIDTDTEYKLIFSLYYHVYADTTVSTSSGHRVSYSFRDLVVKFNKLNNSISLEWLNPPGVVETLTGAPNSVTRASANECLSYSKKYSIYSGNKIYVSYIPATHSGYFDATINNVHATAHFPLTIYNSQSPDESFIIYEKSDSDIIKKQVIDIPLVGTTGHSPYLYNNRYSKAVKVYEDSDQIKLLIMNVDYITFRSKQFYSPIYRVCTIDKSKLDNAQQAFTYEEIKVKYTDNDGNLIDDYKTLDDINDIESHPGYIFDSKLTIQPGTFIGFSTDSISTKNVTKKIVHYAYKSNYVIDILKGTYDILSLEFIYDKQNNTHELLMNNHFIGLESKNHMVNYKEVLVNYHTSNMIQFLKYNYQSGWEVFYAIQDNSADKYKYMYLDINRNLFIRPTNKTIDIFQIEEFNDYSEYVEIKGLEGFSYKNRIEIQPITVRAIVANRQIQTQVTIYCKSSNVILIRDINIERIWTDESNSDKMYNGMQLTQEAYNANLVSSLSIETSDVDLNEIYVKVLGSGIIDIQTKTISEEEYFSGI